MFASAERDSERSKRQEAAPKRSLISLITDLPGLFGDLVRGEIESLKAELVEKLKHAGIGIGMLVVAGVFAFFATGVFTAAGILGLAEVLPAWASALIVGGALLVITAILAVIGVSQVKRGTPPTPDKTITSIKKDVDVIKGIG
ncbi:MAG: phage holin family protein [Ilumatobacteraceae bacterium]|nr:phage holin family protein [Ilumatobacteraceae bacterium]